MTDKDTTASGAAATFAAIRLHRRKFLTGSAAVLGGTFLPMPAVLGQAKEFDGVVLNGASFTHGFQNEIKAQLPEFEALTGIKVNLDLQAFAIYNQRMDLELSTQGSSYDFCNITFPFAGRWVGAGWMTPLEEFTSDPAVTPPDWAPEDFIGGAQAAFTGSDGKVYGYSWVAGVQMLAAARFDLVEKAGLAMPKTFDEMLAVCEATNSPECAAFANDKLHHWAWPPYLMGFGGRIFQDIAAGDLTPVLDSAESIAAADFYARLLRDFSPPGVLSYTDEQVMRGQFAGRINMRTMSLDWLLPIGKSDESKTRDTVRYASFPGGPAGSFPGVNSQGYGIPVGAKNKRAAWEFIKWSLSKENIRRLALEKNQLSVTRKSVMEDPEFKAKLEVNGQDVAAIYMGALEQAGAKGYMKYRTLPVYPQVGEKISKAIERITSGQALAEEAMKAANQEVIDDLKKAGAL